MAETTNISWADATLNFWVGCTEVSNGPTGACVNCYARTWANRFPRYRDTWGPHAERVKIKNPLAKAKKIIREAKASGIKRPFVFSNSLADIFDNAVPIEWLAEAFAVMRATPEITYLLLTKRPGNIVKRAAAAGGLPANAAIGCTVVTQDEANRDVPTLLLASEMLWSAGTKPAFLFLSCEPLQTEIDLRSFDNYPGSGYFTDALLGKIWMKVGTNDGPKGYIEGHREYVSLCHSIRWVITGGESGAKARPANPDWFRFLRHQCELTGAVYHHKQNGEWLADGQATTDMVDLENPGPYSVTFMDAHGVRFEKVGVKRAGRRLDGRVHDARPQVRA